jgi:hypothetical protein
MLSTDPDRSTADMEGTLRKASTGTVIINQTLERRLFNLELQGQTILIITIVFIYGLINKKILYRRPNQKSGSSRLTTYRP